MKSVIQFILISTIIINVKSTEKDTKDCIWNYKCCKYQETEGVISCKELCDPVINCDLVEVIENHSDTEDKQDYSIRPAGFIFRPQTRQCRPGYRIDSRGSCRRILK
jgi:hypothetical protein